MEENDLDPHRILTIPQRRERFSAAVTACTRARSLDPSRALDLAEESLALASALDDDSARAVANKQCGLTLLALARHADAVPHLLKADRLFRETDDRGERGEVLLAIGSARTHLRERAAAIAAFSECHRHAEAAGDAELAAVAMTALGNLHSGIGEHDVAVRYYHEALTLRERSEEIDDRVLALACSDVGVGYVRLGELRQASDLFRRALELAQRSADRHLEGFITGNLGAVCCALGELETARDHAMRAMVIHEQIGDRRGLGEAMITIAAVEEKRGALDDAVNLYRGVVRLAETAGDDLLRATALAGLGSASIGRGDGWSVVAELETGLEIAGRAGSLAIERRFHELLARAFEEIGENDTALRHFKAYAVLRDGENRESARRAAADLESSAAIERTRRELDDERRSADQLRAELERQAREMAAMTISLVQKEGMLETLKDRLRESGPGARADGVEDLIEKIDAVPTGDDAWKEFERKLDVLHPDFIGRLGRNYTQLTPMEVRICALLRSDMSTKDIASILFLSERTVENHRYRLRRKLGLTAQSSLALFLASL